MATIDLEKVACFGCFTGAGFNTKEIVTALVVPPNELIIDLISPTHNRN